LLITEAHLLNIKLWHHGKVVGNWSGEFIIQNNPFLRQMIGGVRTEDGIKKATNMYMKKQNLLYKDNIPTEIKNIMNK